MLSFGHTFGLSLKVLTLRGFYCESKMKALWSHESTDYNIRWFANKSIGMIKSDPTKCISLSVQEIVKDLSINYVTAAGGGGIKDFVTKLL